MSSSHVPVRRWLVANSPDPASATNFILVLDSVIPLLLVLLVRLNLDPVRYVRPVLKNLDVQILGLVLVVVIVRVQFEDFELGLV